MCTWARRKDFELDTVCSAALRRSRDVDNQIGVMFA